MALVRLIDDDFESAIDPASMLDESELREAGTLINTKQCKVDTVCKFGGKWSIHPVRLKKDGELGYIVSRIAPGFCGSGGCTENLLRKDGNGWRILVALLGTIAVERTYTNGLRDVVVSSKLLGLRGFVWNGAQYIKK